MRKAGILVALAGLFAGWFSPPQSQQPTRLVFIRCAQGSCALFQHAGRNVLVDCGPRNDRVDAGERLIALELYRLGVVRLDMVIVTHPDADHVGGLVSLARRFPVDQVVMSDLFAQHPDMKSWMDRSRIAADRITTISPERSWAWAGWRVSARRPRFWQPDTDNNGSLAIVIEGPGQRALITGDAAFEAEEAMIADGAVPQADVLAAGHHGSRTSTGDALLERVRPKHVVFSVGRNNSYGHPSPEVFARVDKLGARIWRTDRQGSIEFLPSAGGWVPTTR